MSRRIAALAALAVVVGCAGCDATDVGTATSTGNQLTSGARRQLDQKTAAATAAAKQRAADLAAQAQQALQKQIATAVQAAADKAVQQAVQAAAQTAASASTAASALPSAAAVVPVAPAAVEATHTVTGTFTSPEAADVSGGSVACATEANVVGQEVTVRAGAVTVTGTLTGCTWSAPGVLGSSPVFSLVVQKVPEASSYDISIGDRSWSVSGTTLSAAGWLLALS